MKLRTLAVGLMVGGLALTACGQEGSPGGGGAPVVTQSAAAGVQLQGSPTFDKITQRGSVVIGVKEDQPGLGFKDATTNEYSGFDIEIARLVAAQLGLRPRQDRVQVDPVGRPRGLHRSAARSTTTSAPTPSTTSASSVISFAGPYYQAGQSILVRSDESAITGKDTLKGKKVCSATGSTPIQRVRDQGLTEPENIVEFQTYTQCVDQLLNKQVDAVTTDDAILAGYASQQPDKLKLVGEPFSQEPYGIGLAKDDSVLRNKINDILQAAEDDGTWKKIYDETLGKSGATATPPALQRY